MDRRYHKEKQHMKIDLNHLDGIEDECDRLVRKLTRFGLVLIIFCVLSSIGIIGGLVYAACHFIAKYW
jgi:hypothetical protein